MKAEGAEKAAAEATTAEATTVRSILATASEEADNCQKMRLSAQ